jgi:SAM-dependent methyltransferase
MDWELRYETGDTPWDEGGAHPALVDFVTEAGAFEGRVLVPGCGRGHDVRAVSTAGNRVTGLDIAPGAIEEARGFARTGGEEYVAGDLFKLEEGMRGAFDWVVEHTCFCAIDPAMRAAYVEAVAGTLKPGGRLFGIFYLEPAIERQPPYGVTAGELDGLFSARFEVEREWVPGRTFEGREGRELIRVLRRRGGEI